MHLGNGALTPECAAIAGGLAAAGVGMAAGALRREPMSREKLALAAGLGALVFAAQAINVPVLPGTSAHLVGGVLLAWVLGPGLGSLTMAVVLVLQALMLGDGGLAALGANILNMALLPSAIVALMQRLRASESRWGMATSAAAAALSVPLAATLIVGETMLFRSAGELVGWQDFAARMIGTHLWIGIGEGALTAVLATALVASLQPGRKPTLRPALACGLAALLLAAVMFPFGSTLPDGYEAAAEGSGLSKLLGEGGGAIASLQAGVVELAQRATVNEQVGVLAATLLTALLVAGIAALAHRTETLTASS